MQIWSHRSVAGPEKTIQLLSGLDGSARYIEFYFRCARPMLASTFDNDFWSRTALQMAFAEPSVRHALIALGYLHSTEPGSMSHARSRFAGQRESGILLHHYNESIRGLLDRMSEPSYTPEVGLVTCLLFVCMEFLRGNHHTAYRHLTSGMKMIFDLDEKKRRDSFISLPMDMPESVLITASCCKSTLVENELKPIFTRALASAMMYGATYQLGIPPPREQPGLRFQNIRDVQLLAHELRNQSILHIYTMTRRHMYSPEQPFTAEELEQHDLMLSCQADWYRALKTYRDEHHLSDTDELAVSALLMHHHATHVWALCSPEVNETLFDAHLEDFKAILHHAERILDSMDLKATQLAAKFTFEISLIPSLYFVATRCRCPTTRRKAVALLARKPPREGLWDAEQHLMVAQRAVELEEKEVDPETGWPVEKVRLWSCVIEAGMDHKGGFWAAFMPVIWVHERTPLGKPKILQEYFIWYVQDKR
jgi:hypothetical protein